MLVTQLFHTTYCSIRAERRKKRVMDLGLFPLLVLPSGFFQVDAKKKANTPLMTLKSRVC